MFGYRLLPLFLIVVLIPLDSIRADIRKDCRKESNVSWAALRKLKAGDFEQEDQKLKCYLKCFMVKNGIMNSTADIDVQRALRHIPRSLQASSKQLFNKCKSSDRTDPCDKAFQIAKCYVKSHPEILQSVPFL